MAEEKKTTTAKAPAKTVRRVRKTAQKAETAAETGCFLHMRKTDDADPFLEEN